MPNSQLILKSSAIVRVLGVMAFLLVLASVAGQVSKYFLGHATLRGLVPLFYLEEERNIPTFFSGLILMFAALLLAVITLLKHRQRDPDVSKWTILACGFLYMAGDELLSFHERLIMPVRHLLPNVTHGVFFFSWVIPAIAVVLALGLYFLRFLLRLPGRTRFMFLLAAALYVGGAIGGELIEGRYAESLVVDEEDFTFSIMATVEETLEMAGVIVFISALLGYIAAIYKEVQIRVD